MPKNRELDSRTLGVVSIDISLPVSFFLIHGKAPEIFFLVFGERITMNILDVTQKNLKGYKFYNPRNGKTVISRDVEFDEDGSWEWNVP